VGGIQVSSLSVALVWSALAFQSAMLPKVSTLLTEAKLKTQRSMCVGDRHMRSDSKALLMKAGPLGVSVIFGPFREGEGFLGLCRP
jgi:hypothetical protein